MSSKSLEYWVSEQTMLKAGFNSWATSSMIYEHGQVYSVYASYLEDRDLNIVIIAGRRMQAEKRHREWFFGTFSGTYLDENPTCSVEQNRNFLRGLLHRKHRVAGRKLEGLINQALAGGENER